MTTEVCGGQIKSFTRIIWLNTGFLGDIVLNTAAIHLAAKQWPSIPQYFISTKVGCNIVKVMPEIHGAIPFEKRDQSMPDAMAQVKKELSQLAGDDLSGSVILQPHRSARSTLLSRYLGLPSVTYHETDLSWLFATVRVPRVAIFHEAVRIALLLEPLGMKREELLGARPHLPISVLPEEGGWRLAIRSFKGRLVGISPSSQWGTKMWQREKYIALMRQLLQRDDTGLVLLGSSSDKAYITEIAAKVGANDRLWNLAGLTTLDDLRGLFPLFRLLVSNDSSPIHYASAYNIPTVALFGATVPQMGFAPLADHSVTLGVNNLACRPCSAHGPQNCPLGHFACMKRLEIGPVYDACCALLAKV